MRPVKLIWVALLTLAPGVSRGKDISPEAFVAAAKEGLVRGKGEAAAVRSYIEGGAARFGGEQLAKQVRLPEGTQSGGFAFSGPLASGNDALDSMKLGAVFSAFLLSLQWGEKALVKKGGEMLAQLLAGLGAPESLVRQVLATAEVGNARLTEYWFSDLTEFVEAEGSVGLFKLGAVVGVLGLAAKAVEVAGVNPLIVDGACGMIRDVDFSVLDRVREGAIPSEVMGLLRRLRELKAQGCDAEGVKRAMGFAQRALLKLFSA